MALSSKSLFLYNYQVTPLNSSLDFRAVNSGPVLFATLNLGYYSLTALQSEIARAMQAADPSRVYAVTADRTVSNGLENRVTILSNGSYLDLLFSSGPRVATSVRTLIGFNASDYTGSTFYTGSSSSGRVMVPSFVGYNYLGPEFNQKVFGSINVSASGKKEAIVFQVQQFFQAQFKYEAYADVLSKWVPFLNWGITQKLFEFTPNISNPGLFYECTLEKTSEDGKGLGYKLPEMLPKFPNVYDMGLMTFRVNQT